MLSLQTCYITSLHTFNSGFLTQVSILLDSLFTDRLYRLPENIVWFPSIPLCSSTFSSLSPSLSFLYLPTSLLSLARPQSLWHCPCCKVPFSPSITIIGSDFLHRGSASPEDPPEFHTEIRSHARTHTLSAYKHTHPLETNAAWYIIFTFLFIHLYLSIYPSAFVSWADISLMNNLLLLKETTWGGQRRERMRGEVKWGRRDLWEIKSWYWREGAEEERDAQLKRTSMQSRAHWETHGLWSCLINDGGISLLNKDTGWKTSLGGRHKRVRGGGRRSGRWCIVCSPSLGKK